MQQLDLGIIGVSKGNGHPYSFSAIVNGYSDEGFEATDWAVIHDYLRERDDSEFGFPGVKVTHAWTQHDEETERLCTAAKIPHAVNDWRELPHLVDGVIIARDDYETHYEMARPFLDAGLNVFVDKPLTLDSETLRSLRPALRDGSLMSCSGMRFARELDEPRATLEAYGDIQLVRGTVINGWEKYGVHLLDAIFGVLDSRPTTVQTVQAPHESIRITMDDGTPLQIDALGSVPLTFVIDLFGTDIRDQFHLRDNFSAFRRTLWHFITSIRSDEPALPCVETLDVIKTLIAGKRSIESGQDIVLDELDI